MRGWAWDSFRVNGWGSQNGGHYTRFAAAGKRPSESAAAGLLGFQTAFSGVKSACRLFRRPVMFF
ncbi:hypothetical protein HMPREF9120_01878 [Neisseria sp. oral taxon 020 str. F0370]|nr:hypothetical protein HMPREF9120_01878 [Neisseria sp. oral taxon 020 str. F0370]